MKKLILSVAILAVAASCSKNEVTDLAPSLQNEIGFTTLNDRVVSKAANDGKDNFRLYAIKGTSATAWFIADYVTHVTGIESTPTGTTNGTYYWPTDGDDITFYGYAPYASTGGNVVEGSTTAVTNNKAVISLTYTVPTNANEDFTVATPVTATYDSTTDNRYEDALGADLTASVPLTFNHMLSKVSFEVVLDSNMSSSYEISVDEGDTDDNTTYNESDVAATFDFTVAYNQVTVDGTNPTATATTATTVQGATTTSTYSSSTEYMVVPQALANCKIQIKGITIRDKNTNESIFGRESSSADLSVITLTGNELSGGSGVTNEVLAAGTHYTFKIIISSSSTADGGSEGTDDDTPILGAEIKVTANSSWSEVTGQDIDQN